MPGSVEPCEPQCWPLPVREVRSGAAHFTVGVIGAYCAR